VPDTSFTILYTATADIDVIDDQEKLAAPGQGAYPRTADFSPPWHKVDIQSVPRNWKVVKTSSILNEIDLAR